MRNRAIIALAALFAATPLALAPAQAAVAGVQRHATAKKVEHRWKRGERFDQKRATRYSSVDYRRYRGLKAPGRGQRWVRSGNDAVLIASNGTIAQVIANVIR